MLACRPMPFLHMLFLGLCSSFICLQPERLKKWLGLNIHQTMIFPALIQPYFASGDCKNGWEVDLAGDRSQAASASARSTGATGLVRSRATYLQCTREMLNAEHGRIGNCSVTMTKCKLDMLLACRAHKLKSLTKTVECSALQLKCNRRCRVERF